MKYGHDQFLSRMNIFPHWRYDKNPDSRAEGLRNAWGEFGIDFTMKFEAYLEKLTEFRKDFKLDMKDLKQGIKRKMDL